MQKPQIAVTEEDLRLAIVELNNSGRFELVGTGGERVVLVSAEECHECGRNIPDSSGSIANRHHALSCSLHDEGE